MCLKIKQRFNTKKDAIEFAANPIISKTNKTVYKVLKQETMRFISPYYDTEYKLGELKTEKRFGKKYHNTIYYNNNNKNKWILEFDRGFHAYTKLQKAKKVQFFDKYYIIVKCIIPKGTPYFIGANDDIITLAIQMPSVFNKIC